MKPFGKLLITVFFLAAVSSAQSHSNFSGTWKLNAEKSDMGTSGVTALVAEINHKDPVFTYTAKGTAGGQEFEETETFTTDGKPSQDSHGATVKARWEGATLVSEATGNDGSVLYVARLSLSDDGKTITRVFKQSGDPQPRHEVYEKQ